MARGKTQKVGFELQEKGLEKTKGKANHEGAELWKGSHLEVPGPSQKFENPKKK